MHWNGSTIYKIFLAGSTFETMAQLSLLELVEKLASEKIKFEDCQL